MNKSELTLVINCLNIRQVIFNNVSLQQLENNYNKFTNVNVLRLRVIIFRGTGNLTEFENQVLDFLHLRTKLFSLEALCFQTLYRQSTVKVKGKSSSNVDTPSENVPNILTQFLQSYILRLKTLEVNRSGMKIFNENTRFPKDLRLTQETLICNMNTAGFEKCLGFQTKLKSLHCYNSRFVPPEFFDNIMITVNVCEKTLEDVRLSHKYIFKGNDPGGLPGSIEHDMCAYKFCHRLRKLNLDISMANYPSLQQPGQPSLISPGEIINLTCLPTPSLETLIVRFDIVKAIHLENFARKFSQYTKLKFLIVHGNPTYPYRIHPSWVEILIGMPQMEIFEFHFCEVDVEAVELFAKSIKGLPNKLEVTPVSCIFWKTAHF